MGAAIPFDVKGGRTVKRTYLIVAFAAAVVMVASVIGVPTTADQPPVSGLQKAVGGVDTQAMAYFRLDKTCERGNTRCR